MRVWLGALRIIVNPYTIMVDGKPMVTVRYVRMAKEVLNEGRLGRAEGVPSGAVRFTRAVTLARAPKDEQLTGATPSAADRPSPVTPVVLPPARSRRVPCFGTRCPMLDDT
jgi:hypothetical protein